jgi:hypothetical protein
MAAPVIGEIGPPKIAFCAACECRFALLAVYPAADQKDPAELA